MKQFTKAVKATAITVGTILVIIACSAPVGPTLAEGPGGPSLATTGGGSREYIAIADDSLPPGFDSVVSGLGGDLLTSNDEAGIAVVSGSARFSKRLARVAGMSSVVPNITLNWLPGDNYKTELESESIGDDETYFNAYQWSMRAIDAPAAWDAGYTGEGATVAILDSGIDPNHPDLAPNLNIALSTSFVPHEPFIDDLDAHGTHVAGLVAAADNGFGSIGVAPNAEIIAVKVLDGGGSGDFDWVLQGILYANEVGADVINMSLGATLQRRGLYQDGIKVANANEIANLVNALKKVINYVTAQGTLVVTSAGNESQDSTGDSGLLHLPSDAGNTISVSATGPLGWALDPETDLDAPAVYTNYGNAIDLAAPGGNVDFALYPNGPWYFDLAFSTFPGGWGWMAGTSQAAPHVAGVAALIIGANGGDMDPALVEQILRQSADDLGKPGRDQWYGHGRINAGAAVN